MLRHVALVPPIRRWMPACLGEQRYNGERRAATGQQVVRGEEYSREGVGRRGRGDIWLGMRQEVEAGRQAAGEC